MPAKRVSMGGGGGSSIANFYGPPHCFVLWGDSGKIVIFAILLKSRFIMPRVSFGNLLARDAFEVVPLE